MGTMSSFMIKCAVLCSALVSVAKAYYSDQVCGGYGDDERTAPQSISINDQTGKPLSTKAPIQVSFGCERGRPFDHIRHCFPEDHTEETWRSDTAEPFKSKDGNWYKLKCSEYDMPIISEYFAREICQKDKKISKVAVKDALGDTKEVDISLDCNTENTKITTCHLSDPVNSKGVAASKAPGRAGGLSGEKYEIACSPLDKPIVTEKFLPEVCHTKTIATPTPKSKTSKNRVTIRCNAKTDAVEWCTPENGKKGVKAGGKCDIKKFGSSTFTLACYKDEKPEIDTADFKDNPAC